MGPVAAGIGAVSGVVGGINSKNQENAANAQAQQASQNQAAVNQQLLNNITNQTNQYNSSYAPALAPLSSGMVGEGNVASSNISGLVSALTQAGLDPSVISQITGVDASSLTQNALNYLSNPSGTNLAGATPGAQQFYSGEMQNGIDPKYAQNAQNQIQQSLNQQQQNVLANAQPGQNTNALIKDMNNQALTQSTNLAGNLAGQNQTIEAQGAQGLLSSASGLDSQTMGMLQNAATGAQNFNQQAYNNLGTSSASAQGILSALQNFIGQGQGAVQAGYSPLSGMSSQYGASAANATSAANAAGQNMGSAFGSAANGLASLFPMSSAASTPAANTGDIYGAQNSANLGAGTTFAQSSAASPLSSSYTLGQPQTQAPAASPLSVSTPSTASFNPGLFTGGVMAGGNYAA